MKYIIILLPLLSIITTQVYAEELEITIIPSILVNDSDALLILKYSESPFIPEILSIVSSNRDVIQIHEESVRNIGNSIIFDISALASGNSTITVIPESGKPVSRIVEVHNDSNIPSSIDMKISPSSFSYIGPKEGYISLQLLNSRGMPIKADKDYIIRLSSSNPDLVMVDDIIIRDGEYFALQRFTINGYGESIIKARYDDLVTESKIIVEGYSDTHLVLDIEPSIAPAINGQMVYAFIQLQDTQGNPIYASNDMYIELESIDNNIIVSPAIIREGESVGIARLIINSDKPCNDCKVYAVYDEMRSNTASIELREAIIDNNKDTERIYIPVLFTPDIKVIADGKENTIGVIQLMDNEDLTVARPIIPPYNMGVSINSDLIDAKDVVIEKPYSTILVNGKVGYLAGTAEIELFGSELERYASKIELYGHRDVTMVAESLVDNVIVGMEFPYMIYFKDSDGLSSYSINNANMLISYSDNISIESEYIKEGDAIKLLDASALAAGDAIVRFETTKLSTVSTLTIHGEEGMTLRFNIDDTIINSTKGFASIEAVDGEGYPFDTSRDLTIYIYSSDRLVNIPSIVTIPKGKHYTVFPIEAKGIGKSELTIFTDGIEPISKSIEVVDDSIQLNLTNDKAVLNDYTILTLNALYKGNAIDGAEVRWNNNKGLPIEYDTLTSNGIARAKYLLNEEGEYIFTAILRYNGIEKSSTMILSISNNTSSNNTSTMSVSYQVENDQSLNEYPEIGFQLPIDIKYLFIIPAIIGISIGLIKKR